MNSSSRHPRRWPRACCQGFHGRTAIRGHAHTDYSIAIVLVFVVFVTARSWVVPLTHWIRPGLGRWLIGLPEWVSITCCGGLALTIASTILASLIWLTRKS